MYGTPRPVRPQTILNWSAPPADVMRSLRTQPPIDVAVRMLWEVDGEQRLAGQAIRWWRQHVYVELDDRRLRTTGVWVDAADVTRR